MSYRVTNAVILAAGTASRFAPLSYEKPKALIEVNGEVLIERQIRQLREAGISDIVIVVGYMKEKFEYLKNKFGVTLVVNGEYLSRNNNASIYAVRNYLKNTYVCSSDNYFSENPFENEVDDSYYAAVYANGETKEWCISDDDNGYINSVTVGGADSWYMLGHTFWNENFSKRFLDILLSVYDLPETENLLWESIYMQNLDTLKMKIRKYSDSQIFEFDTLDELREFDISYKKNTRSKILKEISEVLNCSEEDLVNVTAYKTKDNAASGMTFEFRGNVYQYTYDTKKLRRE